MTNSSAALKEFVPGSSRGTRTVHTLVAELAEAVQLANDMDQERKTAISQRIKELREESHYTQPAVAERVGVGLRAFQKWEAGGGITYDNIERLAAVFDVSPDYILKGATPVPDLMARRNDDGPQTQLNRIEKSIEEARKERERAADEIRQLLEEQNRLLGRLGQLIDRLGMPEGIDLEEYIIQSFRDAAAASGDKERRDRQSDRRAQS